MQWFSKEKEKVAHVTLLTTERIQVRFEPLTSNNGVRNHTAILDHATQKPNLRKKQKKDSAQVGFEPLTPNNGVRNHTAILGHATQKPDLVFVSRNFPEIFLSNSYPTNAQCS